MVKIQYVRKIIPLQKGQNLKGKELPGVKESQMNFEDNDKEELHSYGEHEDQAQYTHDKMIPALDQTGKRRDHGT